MIAREPTGALRLFVQQLWFSASVPTTPFERVLPTGSMHLVVRLDDEPLRIVDEHGVARVIGTAIIGGARSASYVKDVARPVRSVGAWLRPGASLAVLGIPADALAEQHAALADVWGGAAARLREQLCEASTPAAALARFEAALTARLPRIRGVDPLIAHALQRLDARVPVAAVADETGYSARRFLALFRAAIGLSPKRYGRVQRFQRALAATATGAPLAAIAHAAGYADQAHFTREFGELAGVTPRAYRRLSPARDHHVPLARADSFKTRGR